MATARMNGHVHQLRTPVSLQAWARVFSFPVFLATLLVVGVFVCARLNPPEPDTWWHIATGEYILQTGTWPTSDFYSHTVNGNHWIAYEWLGEVMMALAERGGAQGRVLLLVTWASIVFLLLYYFCFLRCADWKAAFVACVLILPLAALFFTPRPQLMGYAFLLLVLILLKRYRQGRQKTLWFLPVIFLLWVNTHGSFAFGLLVVGLYWISGWIKWRGEGLIEGAWTPEQSRHLGAVLLLSVVSLLVNPYGARAAAYPLEMAFLQPINIANIREWQPLSPDFLIGKLFLILILLFFAAQVLFRMRYRIEEIALLLFAAYSASIHRRFFFLFLLVFAPVLASLLTRWVPRYRVHRDRPVLNFALIVLAFVVILKFFPSPQAIEHVVDQSYPRKAVAFLQQNPQPGPILNEYGWGGYLIWADPDGLKVFIDGRADVYEYGGVLPDYLSIVRIEPNALRLLDRYGIRSCLIRTDDPLSTLLAAVPDWERVYADELSSIFVRHGEVLAGGGSAAATSPPTPQVAESDALLLPAISVSKR